MINLTTLNNGVRIVTEHVPHVESVALGVWVGAGAKNEEPSEHGMSHFLEHMLFKGTARRSARDIADEIASVGGQINAATDREYTTYYARVLKEFLPLAFDVLSDMLLNSAFDPVELEREKDVVTDEIRRHQDIPEDHVHDILTQVTWGEHQLGHSVIGTEETVRAATSGSLRGYRDVHYAPGRLVISAAGNLDHSQLVDLAAGALGSLDGSAPPAEYPPVAHIPARRLVNKDTEAAYFCIGAPGYSGHDQRRYTLAVLDAILGGGMSSRLFQEIREKRGLAYDIGSYRVSFREGGMFAVYGGTGVDTLGEVLSLVRDELRRMSGEDVPEAEFRRAQTLIRGSILLAHEAMGSRMSRMAKSLLDFERLVPLEEVLLSIQDVTPSDVRTAAADLLREESLSMAVIGPAAEMEGVMAA